MLGCLFSALGPLGRKYGGAAGSTLLNGLVSAWTLDETSGTRADSVGTNDLTDNNTVSVSPHGPGGTVASFVNANAEYLSAVVNDFAQAGADWSGEFWVKHTGQDYAAIIGTYNQNTGFGVFSRSNGTLDFYLLFNGGSLVIVNVACTPNVWHHVYIEWVHATNTAGISVDNGTMQTGVSVNGYTASTAFRVGGSMPGLVDLTGLVSEAGFWSRVRDQAERNGIYNSGNGKSYADLTAAEKVGLVSYWNLDEASGTRVDSHGANDLTDNNTVGSETATAGAMHNAAASFVSANVESLEYAGAVVDVSGDFTVACWARATIVDAGMRLFGFGNYGDQVGIMVETENGPWHRLFQWKDGGSTPVDIGNNIGDWVLYLMEYTASTTKTRIMALGSAQNSGVWSADLTYAIPVPSVFWVGYRQGSGWTGQVDAPLVWNRKLTSDEIAELFAAGAGKFYPF
jgi:hypothetical protein